MNIQRKQRELSQMIVSQQARSLLPTHKPPIFSGDPLEFPAFATTFEALIESRVDHSCEKLYFLGQYTAGKAKNWLTDAFKGNQRKSENSCTETKWLLKKHVGDPFIVANAHINKLCRWPLIKPTSTTWFCYCYGTSKIRHERHVPQERFVYCPHLTSVMGKNCLDISAVSGPKETAMWPDSQSELLWTVLREIIIRSKRLREIQKTVF